MTDDVMTRVVVTVERQIGQDTVSFLADSLIESSKEKFEFVRLSGMIAEAMKEYINSVAPTMPASSQQPATKLDPGVWIPVSKLSVTRDKGKRYIKLHGGKYEKYGVVAWPEVLTAAGIDEDQIPDAGLTPTKKWLMKIVVGENNKPRVMAMKHAEVATSE